VESGEVLRPTSATHPAARGWSRSFGLLNPLRAVWWLFTNVRFALVLLVVFCAVSLLGVVLPQKPLAVRGDIVAEVAWLETQEGRFGLLTDPLDRTQLFDVFHARWFGILLALTTISTGAYIISRFPGVWRTVTRPRKRVPERYFEMAPNRLDLSEALDAGPLVRALRRSRYRVEQFDEGGTTYLFADRFAWAHFGSLLTHAAIVVFILSAIVSRADAFSSPLFLAEGSTLPVFPVRDANQMQVELRDAHAAFAADGQPLDYHSELSIYRRGEVVERCRSTVNTPCTYGGYRFYQSAYFGFGAEVEVRDLQSGNVIYRETLALSDTARSPHVVVRDGRGAVLLDESLVLTDELAAGDFTYRGTLVSLPDGRLLAVGLQEATAGEERLTVLEPGEGNGLVQLSLAEGESAESGGLLVDYRETADIPSAVITDLPKPPGGANASADEVTLQMTNVVYGTDETSEGKGVASAPAGGPPALTLSGVKPQAITLRPSESVELDGYRYTFAGQREFAGVTVHRDRSDYLVWVGVGLILLGLIATFWVPRRRFWARITATRTSLAGQAPSHARYARELRRLARDAGAGAAEGRSNDD
jgi:cytochrome c biogenesis protein ResB